MDLYKNLCGDLLLTRILAVAVLFIRTVIYLVAIYHDTGGSLYPYVYALINVITILFAQTDCMLGVIYSTLLQLSVIFMYMVNTTGLTQTLLVVEIVFTVYFLILVNNTYTKK